MQDETTTQDGQDYQEPSDRIVQFAGELTCEAPNKHIYDFASSLRLNGVSGMCCMLSWGWRAQADAAEGIAVMVRCVGRAAGCPRPARESGRQ